MAVINSRIYFFFILQQILLPQPCYDFAPIPKWGVNALKNLQASFEKKKYNITCISFICIFFFSWHSVYKHLLPPPVFVAWRAVCTKFRNKFTVAWWSTITKDSTFMQISFNLQFELRPTLRFSSDSHLCIPLSKWPLQHMCSPCHQGHNDLTLSRPASCWVYTSRLSFFFFFLTIFFSKE